MLPRRPLILKIQWRKLQNSYPKCHQIGISLRPMERPIWSPTALKPLWILKIQTHSASVASFLSQRMSKCIPFALITLTWEIWDQVSHCFSSSWNTWLFTYWSYPQFSSYLWRSSLKQHLMSSLLTWPHMTQSLLCSLSEPWSTTQVRKVTRT